MAFLRTDIASPILERTVSVNLYFPTDLAGEGTGKINGVITLLHGIYGNSGDWGLFTSAYRYAADNGFALVMPSADNSFYNNMAYGGKYYSFINNELPRILASIYRLPAGRENNFIAGLSMGGYGALRIGLLNPDKYAAIGCFSGAVDMRLMLLAAKVPGFAFAGNAKKTFLPVFGSPLKPPEDADLLYLASKVAKLPQQKQPHIFISCGSEDNEYHRIKTQNHRFLKKAEKYKLKLEYREWSGTHEWTFWDRSLAEFIGFIKSNNYGETKKQDWAEEITTLQKGGI